MAILTCTLEGVESVRKTAKLFFIDGGSTDRTKSFLESLVVSEVQPVVISQEGTGLYQVLRQGSQAPIDDPDVTHIGMLHSDDYFITSAFEKYMSIIESKPSPVQIRV